MFICFVASRREVTRLGGILCQLAQLEGDCWHIWPETCELVVRSKEMDPVCCRGNMTSAEAEESPDGRYDTNIISQYVLKKKSQFTILSQFLTARIFSI